MKYKLKYVAVCLVYTVGILCASVGHAQNVDAVASKMEAREHIVKGDTLHYRIFVPEEADSTGQFPVVLFLHGAGERGNDNKAQLTWGVWRFLADSVQKKHPAIVIAPQVPKEQYWARLDWRKDLNLTDAPSSPMQLTLNLLQNVQQQYAVDRRRMYITGLSMGGFGTWDAISRYPDWFAAAVPVCGGGDTRQAHKLVDIPIWNFHGAIDDIVPPQLSRNMIAALRFAGGTPGYSEYPDVGHWSWVQAYREPWLVDWMFSKRK